ncbi:electron transport protein SCO1/SenC [Candidatus Ruthia magnifica str. Cm (Calyptogena magnifica)]|uniref:Electron transport protein SCO1/SenC n=1 Tax=Ruthia magnifica subsp. Calyptogena magnifica TaxID=413404 RepID=A1AX15_RUTMC|nr:SCO family protein [Candidatus Ruthturnera calyptogenae]ABL02472.1 electron transport protein SCO1/SenC [Candidatus Ruthia magnifica str. Cm (Calyptogena magnifica)]
MFKKVLIVVVTTVIALSLYINFDNNYKELAKQLKVSFILYNPDKELSSFSLIDHNNNKFNNKNFKDKWTLLYFIYTHCPDVCPTGLMDISILKSILIKRGASIVPNLVTITFDPIRDTPKVLKTYVTHFDKSFLGVSGDQSQIDQLVQDFGAYYERVVYSKNGKTIVLRNDEPLLKGVLESDYLINHTAWIYLISPDGKIFAGFPSPHNPLEMADDIELLIKNY